MNKFEGPVLFLVPARGGSKGIPRKNLTLLAGRPLIAHVLQTASAAMRMIDRPGSRLVVSTDSEEIASVARAWGAETPFLRPPELARDDSSTMEVILHALETLRSQAGNEPRVVVVLQPTSPLVSAEDITGAIRLFWQTGDPIVGMTENEHPPEWSFYLEDGRLRPLVPGPAAARRQDASRSFRLNGAVYVASSEQLITGRTFITPRTKPYLMSAEHSIDIDNRLDILLAEAVLSSTTVNSIR